MTEGEIADYVAAQFVTDFGTAIQYEVKRESNDPSTPSETTRSLLTPAAELAVIAHFIVSVAPAALAQWRRLRDKANAKSALKQQVAVPPGLKPEIAARAIDASVEKAAEEK